MAQAEAEEEELRISRKQNQSSSLGPNMIWPDSSPVIGSCPLARCRMKSLSQRRVCRVDWRSLESLGDRQILQPSWLRRQRRNKGPIVFPPNPTAPTNCDNGSTSRCRNMAKLEFESCTCGTIFVNAQRGQPGHLRNVWMRTRTDLEATSIRSKIEQYLITQLCFPLARVL